MYYKAWNNPLLPTIDMYPLFPGVWVPIMDRERINAHFYPEKYREIVDILLRNK